METKALVLVPPETHSAIARAAAVLVRSRAVLVAANLFADRADQRLTESKARADQLQAKMADVTYAGQRAA